MFAYKRIFLRFFLIIVFMFSMNAYCIDVHAFRDACRSVKLAPEFHFDEQFIEYFNNKNDDFEKRYFLNNSVFLEAAFFSINNRSFFFGNVTTNFGMGRQGGAILLDPRDIDMAFGPMYEYRTPAITCRAGLDHHCFHQIDNVEWNTLYWNKLYIEAGSNDLRKNQLVAGPDLTITAFIKLTMLNGTRFTGTSFILKPAPTIYAKIRTGSV